MSIFFMARPPVVGWVDGPTSEARNVRVAPSEVNTSCSVPVVPHQQFCAHAPYARAMTDWKLVHADDALVVVDKPAGLLSVPGRGEEGRINLAHQVQAAFADALIVHRLDQATSGLMVFGRGAAMQRTLSMAFAARQVHKRYVAVVAGRMAEDEGRIDVPLLTDWPRRPRQRVDLQQGKPALTHWRVIERGDDHTRVDLEPVTGRSHQLRVHLLYAGHPILGDTLYAPEPQRAPRLLLHATRLALRHPALDTDCAWTSEPPF